MFLQKIQLNNIRSYINETIIFSAGSTLLSGDIGVGKSTILQGIEFALFGTSRPDLPGETLLRKGATNGSVELMFIVNSKEVIIKRNLKKDKNGIKQVAGHIIINRIKKELTAVELKAEIINLLGYPKEFITKNKNYIFRYTIYTPQEEMKFILQENAETRLDVLRKIFNFDKYKQIRENFQNYLREMRTNITILKTKIEPLESKKELLNNIKDNKKTIQTQLKEINLKLSSKQEIIIKEKKELNLLEQDQKLFLENKQRHKATLNLIGEISQQIQRLKQKKENLRLEINNIKLEDDKTSPEINREIKSIELNKNQILTNKTRLQEKINQIQKEILSYKKDIEEIKENIQIIPEKKRTKILLEEDISTEKKLREEIFSLTQSIEMFSEKIATHKAIINHSNNLKEKINSLENCPTCLQEVSKNHKCKIISVEDDKINHSKEFVLEKENNKKELTGKKEQIENKINQIIEKKNQLTKVNLELTNLVEKESKLGQYNIKIKENIQENNRLMQMLSEISNKNQMEILNKRLSLLRELLDSILKKEHLDKNLHECSEQLVNYNEKISKLNSSLEMLEKELSDKEDLTEKLEQKKELLNELLQIEKEYSINKAQFTQQLNNINSREKELAEEIEKLNLNKNKLIKIKEIHHWISNHFLKLTYTIEKQVMLNIHKHFNQIFQDWFSILMEDDEVHSRIDDSFTPVIEQNGYEISFNNLSGGEKTSASLAYRLALNKVINEFIPEIKTKDLLILDEPTDGFSNDQLDKVRDVLDRLKLKQILIVSHEAKIETFVENVIRINKESNSSIVFS